MLLAHRFAYRSDRFVGCISVASMAALISVDDEISTAAFKGANHYA
jgi:hypothetical protein